MTELSDSLPTGWESKFDIRSGRYYYINHSTKTTTWDDPRHHSKTPPKSSNIEQIPLQEFRSGPRSSPLMLRSAKIQDSSLTIQTDTDEAVAKISAMFPTVSETHIRMLMKKYHNREALVISALQVEKNPITTPGPFTTPPPQRNIHHPGVFALHKTPPLGFHVGASRGGSPVLRPGSGTNSTYTGSPRVGEAFRSSPRLHSSPKLKLRYMKSVFPEAEETVILEVLNNNENNIQKTSDVLTEMGFVRKDVVKLAQHKMETKIEEKKIQEVKKEEPKPTTAKVKSSEEKTALTQILKKKYESVADHLITIALESVDYDENRANQILDIIVQEDSDIKNGKDSEPEVNHKTEIEEENLTNDIDNKLSVLSVSQSRQSIKSLLKSEKCEKDRSVYFRNLENISSEHKSSNLINTQGPNANISKGPNSKLLLEDYVNWQGPNSILRKGPQALSKGPNSSLLGNRTYQPNGPNPKNRKGSNVGLAKGSIFSQLADIGKGKSRGK